MYMYYMHSSIVYPLLFLLFGNLRLEPGSILKPSDRWAQAVRYWFDIVQVNVETIPNWLSITLIASRITDTAE
jgi:hypothetical protein